MVGDAWFQLGILILVVMAKVTAMRTAITLTVDMMPFAVIIGLSLMWNPPHEGSIAVISQILDPSFLGLGLQIGLSPRIPKLCPRS